MMFADIEMITATFSPFVRMKNQAITIDRTIALDYLTCSGPHAFWTSIPNRHYALSLILVVNLVASFLAIIILGLYTQNVVPLTTKQTMVVADGFNLGTLDLYLDDKRAGTMLNLPTYYDDDHPD